MKPIMSTNVNLLELARHLRYEYLFVTSERQKLQTLNEKVRQAAEQLFHLAWIAKQQRLNLDHLILSPLDAHPAQSCQMANLYESIKFVDSYKVLGVHDTFYSEFLYFLRDNPKLVASCLAIGEKLDIQTMHSMVHVIMSSIFGNCVLPEDEISVLRLLKELTTIQLAVTTNPLRLLRHGSCAFSRVYKSFNEGLFTAKLFLTASLHDAIMHLLMEDDLFLDIDPSKSAVRFPSQERARHFGKEGTAEYKEKLLKYRSSTINKLYTLTMRFIEGIRNNMFCFPQSVAYLVKQIFTLVTQSQRVESREVGAMCVDLIFAFFICPAIVNPEPYGIMDVHISHIARFNLIQIAQILQVLAMAKWEEFDPKLMDLYGKFERNCMSSILDQILSSDCEETYLNQQLPDFKRSAVLVTETDLLKLVDFMREVHKNAPDVFVQRTLSSFLNNLPNTIQKISPKSSISSTNTDELMTIDIGSVLVIPLANCDTSYPGMLSEEKILSIDQQKNSNRVRLNLDNYSGDDSTGPEKRTRFSLSHDQESIGTSDNLEAISEAASNHSVSSSLDLENDNLSDMVSANVSGRGTPNVSGRDTPSSQLEGADEPRVFPPPAGSKQNGEDMDDRFGRFEIKPTIEDETKSMVSDTWSTDVLASDSETVEQSEPPSGLPGMQPPLELCETASDGWSTDVLPSDTDRLHELDTDDNASVARSDDTASVARSEPENAAAIALPIKNGDLNEQDEISPLSIQVAVSSNEIINQEDLTPTGNGSDAVADEDNFNNMQSLGRLSLAVKELPDNNEPESLITTIQGSLVTPRSRASLADILSLDLTQTLNLTQHEQVHDESSFAEFDKEILASSDTVSSTPKPAHKDLEDSKSQRKSFFKLSTFKFNFKGKPKKNHAGDLRSEVDGSALKIGSRNFSEDQIESGDDILNKYRAKSGSQVPARQEIVGPDVEEDSYGDAPEGGQLANAKRKLRIVLSNADFQALPSVTHGSTDTELVAYLKMLLAESINLQQRSTMAQLHEALRCIQSLDEATCQKLLLSLEEDYKARSPYLAYLVRCSQGLYATLSYLETLIERIERDKLSCTKYLLSICVRMFLEKKERTVQLFIKKFQALSMADEKASLVEKFLEYLYNNMETDPIWQFATIQQLEYSQTVIQRSIMSQIYIYALYPNGDGDVLRDRVLNEHMAKLAKVILPNHKLLKIPKVFQHEFPWPSAQAELITISAFKTPLDKLQCVLNCLSTLLNLLRLANVVPAADDIVPVLVYVLIQANPPALLSTIQYVSTFLEKSLEGEDSYWWTQFVAATEFIKNLDYS